MKTFKNRTLLCVLALLCGCTKNDVQIPELQRVVRFNDPVVSCISKAVGEISEYPTDETFAVFSVYHEDGFAGWEASGTTTYIDRAVFSYNSSLDDADSDGLGG